MSKFIITVSVDVDAKDYEDAETKLKLALIKAGIEEITLLNTGMITDLSG